MIGLLSALLGQGGVWALSWLLPAIPPLVIARHGPLLRPLQRKPHS